MDRQDFTRIARERAVPWRRVAYLICGDWGRAEDLVQAALLRMYKHWHRIEPRGLEAYARKVISRLALDEAKRASRRKEVLGEVPDRPAAQFDEEVDGAPEVRAALKAMPPRQRAVIVLRFYADLDVAATAKALGITQGTVKSQCSRGLDSLRAALGPHHAALATRTPERTGGSR
ncbi:SigE family RNA polymerase sigma factor [Actinosynnema pretiosum subsp. pretiosum]|uniref:RNA polymerase, sigma-24 subunit, ECF subfamily n=2 Tax=Actinosynnema TaxID=40566 RepID=C6WHU9_ACTMD|nr:SigE family RNA polymerase sigma factor [Actinosynnema mirum]ACU34400.1 RNA polymerase, sigma-24 subunit, ECF subfamily [Actinosynnema mirum DSM 43827]AXX27771.1 RNA polymerase ECF sigma factor [Actinosynnema pretiosum subsp. pretiosum]QUF01534.1 SigE family RNA polymerase sigma factor [Actinosynnema pretiosum subsp. pretiosum]